MLDDNWVALWLTSEKKEASVYFRKENFLCCIILWIRERKSEALPTKISALALPSNLAFPFICTMITVLSSSRHSSSAQGNVCSEKSPSVIKKASTQWLFISCSALIYMGKFTYASSTISFSALQFFVATNCASPALTHRVDDDDRKTRLNIVKHDECEAQKLMRLRVPQSYRSSCVRLFSGFGLSFKIGREVLFCAQWDKIVYWQPSWLSSVKLKLIKNIVQCSIECNQN